MRTVWIYTLADPITHSIKYVGKTFRINRRLNDHLRCDGNSKKDTWIKSLKNKNLTPILEIIDATDEFNCDFLEQYWISQLKAWGFTLKNMTNGGDGSYGLKPWNKGIRGQFKHTEESKRKMSLARKGKYIGKNNPQYGKKRSADSIKQQIIRQTGSRRTEEQKNKISGCKSKNSKPVHMYTLDMKYIKTFNCGLDVLNDGFDANCVSKVCRGINKSHKGFIFTLIKLA